MPKPLPPSLAESLPEPEGTNPEPSDVLRVLGQIGLPGEQELDRLGSTPVSTETQGAGVEMAKQAYERSRQLFTEINIRIRVPEFREYVEAGVNFSSLAAGLEGYHAHGLDAEIVFAPVNLSLDSWKRFYGKLRQWQDNNHPSSSFRLKRQSDGDGLWVNPTVEPHWDKLAMYVLNHTPGHNVTGGDGVFWNVLVVPTGNNTNGGLAVNTSHDLTRGQLMTQAEAVKDVVRTLTPDSAHMPIGTYLTLQAGHIMREVAPLDSTTWTWNAGTFVDPSNPNVVQAPASLWSPADGQVRVYRDRAGVATSVLGARLPVWG